MPRVSLPRLHLISDRTLCPLDQFPRVAGLAVDGGADAIHIREKDLAGGPLLETTARVMDAVRGRALVFVNERVDIALLAGADGIQLGETAMTPSQARRLVGDGMLIGRSVHGTRRAQEAELDGADFVLAGNVYPSRSKPGAAGRGVSFVSELRAGCRLPIIAIGGITVERVEELRRAGAFGIAVISGILAAGDPRDAAARYREALDEQEQGKQWN